jgi:pilus assembly protein Flp/PilA
MKSLFVRFVREEAGQDLIEYALIATFVSIVAVAGATLLGEALDTWYSDMAGEIPTPTIP